MSYKVTAGNIGSLSLNETDTVTSVLQNIAIILQTRQGTVPHYRNFGLPMEFIDKPLPVAKPMAYLEVKEAIERWEPRATVIDISFAKDITVPGKLIPTVEVEIRNE
ncbi:MAG: GPW/gp25 family protein [Synergistaceae bacterium]|nr:GPW/gp25 family protein [Synergistaceae bacterium]